MGAELSFLTEYAKFTSTFTLLAFSAGAWLTAKELEKDLRPKPLLMILLALTFLGSIASAYFLIDLMYQTLIEASKSMADRNPISAPIQRDIWWSSWSLVVTSFSLGLFVAFRVYLGKTKSTESKRHGRAK